MHENPYESIKMNQVQEYPITKLLGLVQQAASPEDSDNFKNFDATGIELFCELKGDEMRIFPKVQEMLQDEALNFPVEDFIPGVSADSADSISFEADEEDLFFMVDTFLKKEVDFSPEGIEFSARTVFFDQFKTMIKMVLKHSIDDKSYGLIVNLCCYDTHRGAEVTVVDTSFDTTDGVLIIQSTSLVERRPTFSELAEEEMNSITSCVM